MQLSKPIYSILFLFVCICTTLNSNAQYLKGHLSFFAGLNESKQDINTGSFNSKYNYRLADYQKNLYKPGYFIGLRIEENANTQDKFTFSLSYQQIATGTNYKNTATLIPFTVASSYFKADDHFSNLDLNVHFKKLVFTDHHEKRKLFIIVGPSTSIRLSNQSEDNQIYNNYRRMVLNGDVGAEIENNSSYTLFIHYKQPLTSFTTNDVNTKLSSFQMGILFKANELF
jgi:hypothetical protein